MLSAQNMSEALILLIKRTGHSVKDIANLANMHRNSLDAYINGTREPSLANLSALCIVLGSLLDQDDRTIFNILVDLSDSVAETKERLAYLEAESEVMDKT